MLAIEVAFLTGRYVATAYNTRTEAEWPPHPARLFSALVATHFAAEFADDHSRAAEREALEWLERQGAPHIHASDASHRDVATVFVPVNDVALTDVDDEGRQLAEARAGLREAAVSGNAKALKKAQTVLTKTELVFQKAIERQTLVPRSKIDPDYGRRVLPEHRNRQPRTFPSVTPDDSRATFVWPDAEPTEARRAQLVGLFARVVRLGHSSSLVSMRVVDHPPSPVWHPSDDGELSLRVMGAGQLRALEAAFQRHQEEEPRVMPALAQAYTRQDKVYGAAITPSVFSDQWLAFRRVEGPHLPIVSAVGLSRAIRKTLMSFASEPIAELLSGHTADGHPSATPHLAVVPLAFVGHEHATGTILGVALVLPRSAGELEKRAVYAAASRWEAAFRQEDEDTPRFKLNLGAAGELWLERLEWGPIQASLRPQVWSGPSAVWTSVTPVALDRNPGDLRSRDASKLAAAISAAEDSLRRACSRIGLPEPVRVDVLPAAPWAGAAKARLYPPYPGIEGRAQRVLTHARVEFDRPVRGPVLLGAGRFVGLGLFRPEAL